MRPGLALGPSQLASGRDALSFLAIVPAPSTATKGFKVAVQGSNGALQLTLTVIQLTTGCVAPAYPYFCAGFQLLQATRQPPRKNDIPCKVHST